MSKWISFDDYRLPDGYINWQAYDKAQVQNGDRCYKCGTLILFPNGSQSLCHQCLNLHKDVPVTHGRLIRCPKCSDTFVPFDYEQYELYQEGEHDVICNTCDCRFTVTTRVTYEFESPEIVKEKDDDMDEMAEAEGETV